jgi:hypothetical protein
MQSNHVVAPGEYRDEHGRRREDWLPNSLISGFAATFVMTVVIIAAYWLSRALGDPNGSQIERWFYALHDNSLTHSTEDAVVIAIALNLIVGIGWALLYGYYGAPTLKGPSWFRGMKFAIVPFLLSIVVFFPIMDAGILGKDLGAGPLPVLGNLLLHLIYGAVLGGLYAVDLESWLDGSQADLQANRSAENGAAVGLLAGAPIGLVLSWLASPSLDEIAGLPIIALLGTILGAALGLIIGSFAGIERGAEGWDKHDPHPQR